MFELHINAKFIFTLFQGIEIKRIHNFSSPQMQDGPVKIGKGRLRNSMVLNTIAILKKPCKTKYFRLQQSVTVLEVLCKVSSVGRARTLSNAIYMLFLKEKVWWLGYENCL